MWSSAPNTFSFSFGKKYLDLHLVDFDLSQLVFWFVESFWSCLRGFRVPALPFWSTLSKSSPSWARRQQSVGLICNLFFHHSVWCQSAFLSKFQRLSPLLVGEQSWRRDHKRSRCFSSKNDPEFITFHVSQYGGALISFTNFRRQLYCSLMEWFLRDFQIVSSAATHMSVLHSLLFWEMSLYVTRWSFVINVFLNPALSAH